MSVAPSRQYILVRKGCCAYDITYFAKTFKMAICAKLDQSIPHRETISPAIFNRSIYNSDKHAICLVRTLHSWHPSAINIEVDNISPSNKHNIY